MNENSGTDMTKRKKSHSKFVDKMNGTVSFIGFIRLID